MICVSVSVHLCWAIRKKTTLHDPCIFAITCDIYFFYLIGSHSPPILFRSRCHLVFPDIEKKLFGSNEKLFQWIKNPHKNSVATQKSNHCNTFLSYFREEYTFIANYMNYFEKQLFKTSHKTDNKIENTVQTEVVKNKSANNKEEVLHAPRIFCSDNLLIWQILWWESVCVLIFNLATDSRWKLYEVILNYVDIIEVDVN